MKVAFFAALALVASTPALAQTMAADGKPVPLNAEAGNVPVFPYDITDRPYEVLGEITAEVRKGTIFSKEASQSKIYHELWERGQKLKADAVINASYGNSRVTGLSWGSVRAKGTAIRFKAAAAN
jgi:hypothetical protein